ncbi:hypothetical protein UT300003_32310 [Clostridium sardiniense]
MTTTETIRQTENKLFVLGKLKSKKFETGTDDKTGAYVKGQLTVEVDTPLGKGETKIEFRQNAKTKKGADNGLYKSLETISREYKDADTYGEEQCDLIKVEGEIGDGTYYSVRTGKFVEGIRTKGTFFNRLDTPQDHCCKAGFEGYISEIKNIEGGELEVTIIGIGYEGIAVPIKGIVPQNLAIPFSNIYRVGCTATLNFAIINEVITEQVQQQVGFGEGLGEIIEKHIRKIIIFGGSPVNMANPITEDTVKKAIAIREAKLEENKERAMTKANGGGMNTGFGGAQASGQTGFGAPANGGFGAPAGNGFGTPANSNLNNGFGTPVGGFGMPTNA